MITLDLPSLLILALATWRVSYALTSEAMPFNIGGWIRTYLNIGGILSCLYCVSVWVAIAMLITWYSPVYPLVYVLAISALAIAVQGMVQALRALHFYVMGDE